MSNANSTAGDSEWGLVVGVVAGLTAVWHFAMVAATPGHRVGSLRGTFEATLGEGLEVPDAGPTSIAKLVLVVALELAVIVTVWVLVARRRSKSDKRLADGRTVARAVNSGRHDLTEPYARIGSTKIRARIEDTALVIAPPRSGKTMRHVVPAVLDAPGPTVVTSTKVDVLALTHDAAAKRGRVWVFDPEDVAGWPTPTRWDIVRGCEDPTAATERARGLAAAEPLSGATNIEFFEKALRVVLRCLLHAAALKPGGTMRDVVRWAADFSDEEPFTILRTTRGAAPEWHMDLAKFTRGASPETVASTDMSLAQVLEPLKIERTLAAVVAGDRGFDVDAFLDSDDTLYLVCQSGTTGSAAPLVTAFVTEIERVARLRSQRSETGRLDKPLSLILDEAANIAPIPSLPSLMTDGGGRGIIVRVVVQSMAQLAQRWGEYGARTIFDGAAIKLALGGTGDAEHLRLMSDLAGTYERERSTTQVGTSQSSGSRSVSIEREPNLRPDEIHELTEGDALLLYRNLPGAVVTLPAWWDRKDHRASEKSRKHVAAMIGAHRG